MRWEKLGKLFSVEKEFADWCVSHTSNPCAEYLYDNVFRIYFSCRDRNNRSSITYIDADIEKREVLSEPTEQLLAPGEPGLFDDSGCSLGCILTTPQDEKRIYYMGWHLTKVAPWANFIGMAVLNKDSGKYEKYSRVPIIDRTDADPYSINYPAILYEGGKYRMWFATHLQWETGGKSDYGMRCEIKTGESLDGIHWDISDKICIKGKDESEYAFARFAVLHEGGLYKMFYSYRGTAYRIGYAESGDGYTWYRKDDEVGIDVSQDGWDSEMIEYPFVFDHKNNRYMLYTGNSYGKTGFGLAVLIK